MEATDQTLLSEDDPYREEVKQAREDFPPTTGVLFAFKSGSQSVFNKETLTAMAELNSRFAQIKHAVSVQSLINFRMSAIDQSLMEEIIWSPRSNRSMKKRSRR